MSLLNTLNKFFNPLYLQFAAGPRGAEDVYRDAARKAAGFGSAALVLSIISGRSAASSDKLNKAQREAIETSLGNQFVEIPSKGAPIAVQIEQAKKELAEQRSKKDKTEEILLHKESTVNPNVPWYHLPVIAAAISVAAAGGTSIGSKLSTSAREEKLEEDINKLNKEIGVIIEDEIRRVKGIDKVSNGLRYITETPFKLLGALSLAALGGGLLYGYARGKKFNPHLMLNKELSTALMAQGKMKSPGQIVLPKELVKYDAPAEVKKEQRTSAAADISELAI